MKAPRRRVATDDEPAMTSLIDVVFLLLVFFVWTSSFDKPERDIASQIAMSDRAIKPIESDDPSATSKSRHSDRQSPTEDIVVRIIAGDPGVSYLIGTVEVSTISELVPKLEKIAALPTATNLIVDPDASVGFAECIEVYDHAIGAGFARVLFAVDGAG